MVEYFAAAAEKTRFSQQNPRFMRQQRYKIYVNGRPVFLGTPESIGDLGLFPDKDVFVAPYLGKRKVIKQYLDLLDKNRAVRLVALYAENVEQLWSDFQSCFRLIEAAGGLVENTRGELLVFYRRGSWDLPKGKIDPGETPEQAAVREVQEETGLENVVLGSFAGTTWHTYELKGERILKKTWWYHMTTTDTEVTPQTEEDIEEIRWVRKEEWLASGVEVYGSIRDILTGDA